MHGLKAGDNFGNRAVFYAVCVLVPVGKSLLLVAALAAVGAALWGRT
jgi:hypothetical protein